jgi:non-ribosomal peptide synthetase component F
MGIESARYLEQTHYPLAVTVIPGTELGIKICFDVDRFDPCTIERTLGHFRTVLEATVAEPERRLVDLPSMMESEREQLIGQWNRSQAETHPEDLNLEELTEVELDALIDRLR